MNNQHKRNASEIHSDTRSNSPNAEINGFQALKKLKETEDQIDMLKRRFKVLQVKEDEARSKTINHQKMIHLHEDVQKLRVDKRRTIDKAYEANNCEVETYKQKNKKLKESIEGNLKSVRQSMHSEKKQLNKSVRKQRLQNEKKYEKIKIQDVQEKQKVRNQVVEFEKNQKEKIERYKESRIMETLVSKSKDTSLLLNRMNEREKELDELAKMEKQISRRSAESVQASESMRSRLSFLTQPRKKVVLPDIHNKTERESRDNTYTSTPAA